MNFLSLGPNGANAMAAWGEMCFLFLLRRLRPMNKRKGDVTPIFSSPGCLTSIKNRPKSLEDILKNQR